MAKKAQKPGYPAMKKLSKQYKMRVTNERLDMVEVVHNHRAVGWDAIPAIIKTVKHCWDLS
ncbi:MAG TPA: hypothetical protein VGE12_04720 [Noviherbaspirillum sp.]